MEVTNHAPGSIKTISPTLSSHPRIKQIKLEARMIGAPKKCSESSSSPSLTQARRVEQAKTESKTEYTLPSLSNASKIFDKPITEYWELGEKDPEEERVKEKIDRILKQMKARGQTKEKFNFYISKIKDELTDIDSKTLYEYIAKQKIIQNPKAKPLLEFVEQKLQKSKIVE